MQVNPNETIHLAALIGDTTDATTYYVQCVVRDTATSTTLDTVKLTPAAGNSRRFYGSTEAPSSTGNGRWIDITTTIYTDAGYTTKAAAYPEVLEKYLVAPRWNLAVGGGGSGDPFYYDDTFDRLKAVLIEEIGKLGTSTEVITAEVMTPAAPDTKVLDVAFGRHLAKKGKKTLAKYEAQLAALEESLTKVKSMAELSDTLKSIDRHVGKLDQVYEKILYLFEHHYLKEMGPEGLPKDSKMPQDGRVPSDVVMPIHEVLKDHLARRASIFDALPPPASNEPVEPTPLGGGAGGRRPSPGIVPTHLRVKGAPGDPVPLPQDAVLPDTKAAAGKRKPSDGVIPRHVLRNNREALAQLP